MSGNSASFRRRKLVLVFVVDPLDGLNPAHDSSVAMMEAAQERGHRILAATMSGLEIRGGRTVARCTPLTVRPAVLREGRWHAPPRWYTAAPCVQVTLEDADAVLVRTDPPVDAKYLAGTLLLDYVGSSRCLVINSPAGLRNANEKLFALRWPDLCPDTVVTADVPAVIRVTEDWGKAVLKPTDGMAGRGIMMLRPEDPNLTSIIEAATDRGRRHVVVQRFLDKADEGDRRVIVLNGEPIGAIRRIASGRDFRCNMAAGATVTADVVTSRDKDICNRLAPALAEQGLAFVGIDIIGDHLTEINVTSPTGLREIDAFSGTRLCHDVFSFIERQCAHLCK